MWRKAASLTFLRPKYTFFISKVNREDLQRLAEFVEKGKVRTVVGKGEIICSVVNAGSLTCIEVKHNWKWIFASYYYFLDIFNLCSFPVFPFERFKEAFAIAENGPLGKIIIKVQTPQDIWLFGSSLTIEIKICRISTDSCPKMDLFSR